MLCDMKIENIRIYENVLLNTKILRKYLLISESTAVEDCSIRSGWYLTLDHIVKQNKPFMWYFGK